MKLLLVVAMVLNKGVCVYKREGERYSTNMIRRRENDGKMVKSSKVGHGIYSILVAF